MVDKEPAQLLQNAIRITHEDLYLVSTRVHDYVTYLFDDGLKLNHPETGKPLAISLDGGLEYTRRGGDLWLAHDHYEEMCLDTESPWEDICNMLLWGTRGLHGDKPLAYRPIKELAYRPDGLNHMRAILKNCPNIGPWHRRVVTHWRDVREAEAGLPPRVAIP